jgi:uncharacterized protein
MEFQLDPVEARVFGCLIEKEITTPEYYPLSLNALVNACNQKSSRKPVMQLDEVVVRESLTRLEDLDLVGRVHDSRVIKFEHHARQMLDLRRPEIAILCLLLLRGPQTAGELRNRSERLYAFDDIQSVQSVLERMARAQTATDEKHHPALVTQLSRRSGEKESRYAHLLSGQPATQPAPPEPVPTPGPAEHAIIQRLEAEINSLRVTVDTVLARIEQLEAGASSKGS